MRLVVVVVVVAVAVVVVSYILVGESLTDIFWSVYYFHTLIWFN